MNPSVGIVMGSDSDLQVMREAEKILADFGVTSEIKILSAHRTPTLAAEYAKTAQSRGIQIIIAGAGMANHLAGAMAAHTVLPVIGVPLDNSALKGMDALLSTVQMPPGVPVACVAIGAAKNAAFLSLEIMGLKEPGLQKKLQEYRQKQEEVIREKNSELP